MKNKQLIIGIFALLALGVGGYYFISSQKGNNGELINGKPVAQSHRSYEIQVTSKPSSIDPKKPVTLRYKIKNDKGETLKNYEIVHEKIMHFITIRKDLAYFQHLHPEFNEETGEFTVVLTFPENGPYRIFPDFTPGDDNPQKLPVTVYQDIDVGNSSKYYAQSVVPDSEQAKTHGDYKITTNFPKDTKKQQEITYSLSITKNGKPVTNLENYLGALGHSVILKEGTLDFIHTHAQDTTQQGHGTVRQHGGSQTNTGNKGPKIEFAATFPESGVYKIFTQFQHEGEVQTAGYIVKVK